MLDEKDSYNPLQRRRPRSPSAGRLLGDDETLADVFVPAHPVYVPEADDYLISVELFEVPSAGVMAVAFSSAQLLAERLGSYQPWVQLDSHEYEEMLAAMQLDIQGVLYDPGPGVVTSVWTKERASEYEKFLPDEAE